jgi:ankyrin repeat protein
LKIISLLDRLIMDKFPFNRLPNELKITITSYLSPQDSARLGATCRRNHGLTNEFGKATQDDLMKAVRRTDNRELVKQILKSGVDPSAQDNCAIKWAARNGHTDVVRLLLGDSRVEPSANYNLAIRQAAQNGHTEVVELLLGDSRVDPSAQDNLAIQMAAYEGHTEVVRLLLGDSRVEPSAQNNLAIKQAAARGHTDVVELLLGDPRVENIL